MDDQELIELVKSDGIEPVTEEEFLHMAESIKSVMTLKSDEQAQLYGIYKQATVGNVNIPQPWMIEVVNRTKWYFFFSFHK